MVVFIFIIVLSFVMMKINVSALDATRSENYSLLLFEKIKLARQMAILKHSPYRLVLGQEREGFQFFNQRQGVNRWEWINTSPLRLGAKDKNLIIKIEVFNRTNNILEIYPNGHFTPFRIAIYNSNERNSYTVYGDNNGNIEWEKATF